MRIATFNCENLFARYKFKKGEDPVKTDGFTLEKRAFTINEEEEKRITAAAVRAVDADVIALQEVESLAALDRFKTMYLKGMGYSYSVLIDGNDPRFIDVGLLSRHPITLLRTHRFEPPGRWPKLFSRDCLEAELDVRGKPLLLYINHLKSMMEGRGTTKPKRQAQARRVADIVNERWQGRGYEGNFIVLGDLNDYPGPGTALEPLLGHPGLVNVLTRLPEAEQWTHYYKGKKEYRQLDYLLLSKSLAEANPGAPAVMRRGLPLRAERAEDKRFPAVGRDRPKASDHAPVYMDVELG